MKTLTFILAFIMLTIANSGGDVSIHADYKTDINDKNRLNVNISVLKGNLSEFGRYLHALPEGFQAESDDNNFAFENGSVKYIWISLPAEQNLNFSYTIIVPDDYNGELEMNGRFQYVMNNQRMETSVNQPPVALSPNADVAYEAPKPENTAAVGGNGTASAEKPFNVVTNRKIATYHGKHTVYLKLEKGQLDEMAKFTENIPEGYTVKMKDAQGAVHTYKDGKLNIMWMDVPDNEEIIVSYELVPEHGQTGEPEITGEFSYAYEGVTYNNEVGNADFYVPADTETQVAVTNANMLVTEKKIPVKDVEKTANALVEGLVYRVQIAASHQKVNPDTYFKRYNIYEPVYMHEHQGWQKYLVGSFESYKKASVHKKEVWSSTPIKDAFIAAYNDGDRITVQEALMISNQVVL